MVKFKQRTPVLQSNYNICSCGTVYLQVTECLFDNAATETTARVDVNNSGALLCQVGVHTKQWRYLDGNTPHYRQRY